MFLPLQNGLLALLLLLLAACGAGAGSAGGEPVPPAGLGESKARVVAGSGEPTPSAVEEVRRVVDDELPRVAAIFSRKPVQPFFVHVHADRPSMPAELGAHLHGDSPGFALLGRHQIHLVWGEMRRTGSSLRGVVVHELVHELLDQFVAPNGALIPRWFHEGLAQHIAGDTYLGGREEDLVWRVAARRLLAFGSLRSTFPEGAEDLKIAYAQSYSYVSWLVREHGLPAMLDVARATDDLTSFDRALVGRTNRTTLDLEDAWRDHLRHGSGAPWRVLFDQCFSLLLIGALPVLVLAMMRRLAAEQRAAARLARTESAETSAAPAEGPNQAPRAGEIGPEEPRAGA